MLIFTYIHTVKIVYLLSLLLIVSSCSLNADQEAALNKSTTAYIDARNQGILITYTAMTHPNAIAYYKDRGDEDFMNHFELSSGENSLFLQDGNIWQTESKDKNIHVKYEFIGIDEFDFEARPRKVVIYALSSDDGVSWHFLDEFDYYLDDIIASKDRLIKTPPVRRRRGLLRRRRR